MINKIFLDIGIPCFNEDKYLARCLESIYQQFFNDADKIQIWICDDCSKYSKQYLELIKKYEKIFSFKYVRNEVNSGPGLTRNHVIEKGQGKWITFIDDDDIFIRNPISFLNKNNIDFYFSEIYTNKNKVWSCLEDPLGVINGFIFSRKFLIQNNLFFPQHLFQMGTEDSLIRLLTVSISNNFITIPNFIERIERENDEKPSCFSKKKYDKNFEFYMPCNLELSLLINFLYCIKFKNKIKYIETFFKAYSLIFDQILNYLLLLPLTLRNYYILILYNIYFFLYYHILKNFDLSSIENYSQYKNELDFIEFAAKNFCTFKEDKILIYNYKSNLKHNFNLDLIPTILKTPYVPNIFNYEDFFNEYNKNYWLLYKWEQEDK